MKDMSMRKLLPLQSLLQMERAMQVQPSLPFHWFVKTLLKWKIICTKRLWNSNLICWLFSNTTLNLISHLLMSANTLTFWSSRGRDRKWKLIMRKVQLRPKRRRLATIFWIASATKLTWLSKRLTTSMTISYTTHPNFLQHRPWILLSNKLLQSQMPMRNRFSWDSTEISQMSFKRKF